LEIRALHHAGIADVKEAKDYHLSLVGIQGDRFAGNGIQGKRRRSLPDLKKPRCQEQMSGEHRP
jgi:hypothetical protein